MHIAKHDLDDHNRIVLKVLDDYQECQGEFINACHIDVRPTV